jgi:hypothetical protein
VSRLQRRSQILLRLIIGVIIKRNEKLITNIKDAVPPY